MSVISLLIAGLLTANPGTCLQDCKLSDNGLTIIKTFEGYSPFVYKDSAGLDTIGFGHLIKPGEKFEGPLMGPEAEKLLRKDTNIAVSGVNRQTEVELNQNQADALISFTYNVGEGALRKSTLLKKVNQENHKEVPPEFLKWNKAGGRVVKGLTRRRTAEAELYNLV